MTSPLLDSDAETAELMAAAARVPLLEAALRELLEEVHRGTGIASEKCQVPRCIRIRALLSPPAPTKETP